MSQILKQRRRRQIRIRAKVKGTGQCPRLSVFRSNAHIYAQLIDDDSQKTLVAASDLEIKTKITDKDKTAQAHQVGLLIAKKAKEKNIEKIAFDRGGYKYHGRIKALAEGARQGGLKF